MALFPKKPAAKPKVEVPSPPKVEWELTRLVGRLRSAAPPLEAKEVVRVLVQARLADHYRDLGLDPLEPSEFDRLARELDVEGWRCLALAVATLDDPDLRVALAALAPRVPVASQYQKGFLDLARESGPLTVGLVRQSAVRAEEFARRFSERLGIGILGESDQESRDRLWAIDYKRLLAEAEEAKLAAREKMDRLRKQQAEADQGRRRGKW